MSGEGQVVLLSGEPGIGKSRLTAALLERPTVVRQRQQVGKEQVYCALASKGSYHDEDVSSWQSADLQGPSSDV
jgi:predicted ATPase